MNALYVENLCVKANGRHLLENITFSVEEGKIVAIIGPNGAGKTTLIKAILGLIPYDTGSIKIFDRDINQNKPESKVGYIPQRFEFDRTFPLTVAELLGFSLPPMYSFRIGKRKSEKERINALLEIVGAGKLAGRNVGSLSG